MNRRESRRAPAALAATAALAAIALGALTGCGGAAEKSEAASSDPDHPPVVLLVFDELPTPSLMKPDHHVDAERYPNFAELESTSTFYRDATTVADATFAAVPVRALALAKASSFVGP